MYVKTIVIEGFKSYGRRTEISGFDKEFNAITGLNGSGKSNILDAICFVLGLQNLVQVRATLLQDLVYKKGQTGVTKASVSITFDNADKSHSPMGYEDFNEIVVARHVILGGRNKYTINALTVLPQKVKDLFCSVQLNVNNPHFLVMQGRIMKVMHMKPGEILSMIEEAAGTRMFESKKQQAEKTLQKKDAKLAQIDEIVKEEITPKLTKLKVERGQFLELKKTERELEHLQKISTAWNYVASKELGEKATENSTVLINAIKEKKQAIEKGQRDAVDIDRQVNELHHGRDEDGKLPELESELSKKEREMAKSVVAQKQNTESIQDEKKKIKLLEKNIKDDESVLKNKSTSLTKIDSVFRGFAEEEERDKAELERAQNRFQALSSGLVADDTGKEGTLQDKLMASERAIAQAQTEIEQCQLQRKHCETELKKKTSEMQKTESEYKKDSRMLEALQEEVRTLERQLASLNHKEGRMEALQADHRQLKHDIRQLREKIDIVESRDARLTFRYRDPETNFNRKCVHGLVCKLISINDPQFALSVEKTAGGRLYNVIVDTDITSKKLLSKGQLERRTTIIPLNKIAGRTLDQRTIHVAENLVGKENVWPALSLISYDPALQRGMEYIFGTTFICRDLTIAKKVCYNRDVMKRCVTLDGDVCDPSGTLSGGARAQGTSVLLKLHEIKTFLRDLEVKEQRIAEVEKEMQQLGGKEQQYNSLKQKYDLKSHELAMVQQRLQQTTHYQYQEEVNALKQKIEQFNAKQHECTNILKTETKNVKEIQDSIKNAKSNREKELKAAENEVKQLKKKSEQSRKEREKRTDEYDSLKLEVEELKKSIQANKEQIEKHLGNIEKLERVEQELEAEAEEKREEVKKAQVALKAVKDFISKKNKEIAQLHQKKETIAKEARELELEIKQAEQDLDKLKQQIKDCKNRVNDLLKNHDWILEEEQFFGQKNGIYDFKEINPGETNKRITKLQEMKEKLSRVVNAKAMNMLAKTEEQSEELVKKRTQVEDDKKKIMEVITELAEKKKDALNQACVQVNRDFGSIFSTLLPGANAKLEPPEGMTFLEGLEFKVGFGGKWKESLGELSGGQKSLVALSLILSMLRFNPAPIYILDEVDAALDLSHTQNIGQMLRAHFRTSQFIIVSLKDGMFNNANVLFRTKLVDGLSTVTRTAQRRT